MTSYIANIIYFIKSINVFLQFIACMAIGNCHQKCQVTTSIKYVSEPTGTDHRIIRQQLCRDLEETGG